MRSRHRPIARLLDEPQILYCDRCHQPRLAAQTVCTICQLLRQKYR